MRSTQLVGARPGPREGVPLRRPTTGVARIAPLVGSLLILLVSFACEDEGSPNRLDDGCALESMIAIPACSDGEFTIRAAGGLLSAGSAQGWANVESVALDPWADEDDVSTKMRAWLDQGNFIIDFRDVVGPGQDGDARIVLIGSETSMNAGNCDTTAFPSWAKVDADGKGARFILACGQEWPWSCQDTPERYFRGVGCFRAPRQ